MIEATHGILSITVQSGIILYFTGHVYIAEDTGKYTIISRWDQDKRFATLFKHELAQRVADTLRANSRDAKYCVVEERLL